MPVPGVVRIADMRAVFGQRLRSMTTVTVAVLPAIGGLPVIASVSIGCRSSGHAVHDALLCPACKRAVGVLHVGALDQLGCIRCHRVRTRQQAAVRTTAWQRYGEREADALVRLLRRGSNAATIAKAQHIADRLASVDAVNVQTITEFVDAALVESGGCS